MCGIVGYVGEGHASEIILDGLRRLEYRGYDSAGIVTLDGARLQIRRRPGKIGELAALLAGEPTAGVGGAGPYAVGDARGTLRAQLAPPPRLRRRCGGRPQWDHRELLAPQAAAPGGRARVPIRDRHRGHRASGRDASGRARRPAGGGAGDAAGATGSLCPRGDLDRGAGPSDRGQARRGERHRGHWPDRHVRGVRHPRASASHPRDDHPRGRRRGRVDRAGRGAQHGGRATGGAAEDPHHLGRGPRAEGRATRTSC